MQSKNRLEVNVLIVVIAQEGSFSRAAKMLRIAQPSLSRKVASLEKDLGAKLFERSTRRLELTKAGQLFVQESSLSLNHAERAWDLARFQARIENGPCRIGYSPYTHSAFPPLLNNLKLNPRLPEEEWLGVELESANTLELVERVLRNRLHAALGIGPLSDEDLWLQPVGIEGFTLCLPRDHRLARKEAVTVQDLDGEMIFWMPRSLQPRFYGRVTKYIHSAGAKPVFREVRATSHALELVALGFGLAMLPRSAARISHAGILFRPLADRYLHVETVLFMRRDQRYGYIKDLVDDLYFQLLSFKIKMN